MDQVITLVDQVRAVCQIACRLFLGAEVARENGVYIVRLDGKEHRIEEEIYQNAEGIARALAIKPRRLRLGSDVLDLRDDAEDLFLEQILGKGDLPKVLFVPAQQMASAHYRALMPSEVLSQKGSSIAQFTLRLDLAKALRYDILWIQLMVSPLLLDIARAAKEAGVKIIYDVDDKFDAIPGDNPAAELYTKQQVDLVWEIIELADLVTVSTKPLAEYIRTRANNVKVLPNMIPATTWPVGRKKNHEIFRILWAGSATHSRDLAIIAPALKKILLENKGKVRFTLLGEKVPEALEKAGEYIDLQRFVPFEEYSETLADIGADLALAPLANDEFNSCKSAIKYLEYSACGYPSVLSPVAEYSEIVKEHGAPAVLAEDGEWEEAIREAILRPEAMKNMAAEAQQWVRKNRCLMRLQAAPWEKMIEELASARRENRKSEAPA